MADDDFVNSGGVGLDDVEDVLENFQELEEAPAEETNQETDAKVTTATATSTDPLQMLYRHHPECKIYYVEAITPKLLLLAAPPDTSSRLEAPDPNHRSQPWISQFERTKILGFRANQLAQGAKPYVPVPKHIVTTADIARLELKERRLPFIISRIMPDGSFEFWRLSDLMII
jgi:DNA-directed RNA polymerase I, II, and III subunit RPABC2